MHLHAFLFRKCYFYTERARESHLHKKYSLFNYIEHHHHHSGSLNVFKIGITNLIIRRLNLITKFCFLRFQTIKFKLLSSRVFAKTSKTNYDNGFDGYMNFLKLIFKLYNYADGLIKRREREKDRKTAIAIEFD
jgi:hypothetical protein